MPKFYLTTPIYYVNAKPHIGSAYTTIAADVLARWHKQQGDDVYFLTGTAEHGTKIAQAATKAGKSPQAFVDDISGQFQYAWEQLKIQPTDFIRTTESRHEAAVQLFFEKLKTSGKIYEGEYEGLYCVGHEAFIKESELDENGLCPDHKIAPERIKEKNWFFKLSDYAQVLKQKITSDELRVEPAGRKAEVLAFIERGLEDISISRQNVEWAFALPWDAKQTIYVWLDELFNYCSAIGYGVEPDKFNRYWPADVHLIGKDIVKFHAIIWPALLLAIGEALPKKIFAHGYFTVDGQKISKTIGNVVDPVELVQQYGADAVRYYLLREIPFGVDGDFSHERFRERYNADLANGLGNLVSRTLTMIQQFWPEYDGEGKLENSVEQKSIQASGYVEKLAFNEALNAIWDSIRWADLYIETKRPWELAKTNKQEELRDCLSRLFTALKKINEDIAPFLPEAHQTLTKLLAARPIKKPAEPLFKRLD